jgi:hypothetical protein
MKTRARWPKIVTKLPKRLKKAGRRRSKGELICPEDIRAKMQQHKEDWLKIRRLPEFFGQGLWEGDLSDMREDSER